MFLFRSEFSALLFCFELISLCLAVGNQAKTNAQENIHDVSIQSLKAPDVYTIQAILRIPYAEIDEPFTTWFDYTKKKSRIDYYGGMVKTYQLSDKEEFGSAYKIAPMTDEESENTVVCFQVNGTKDEPVIPQTVIPNLTNFSFISYEVMNGIEVVKLGLTITEEQKTNKYLFWSKKETFVPIRYEMKGFNTLLGSHYDHYIIEYNTYSEETFPDDVFVIQDLQCRDFPGPGNRKLMHKALINPMQEFIHNDVRHIYSLFNEFQNNYNKLYTDHKEIEERRHAFHQNLRFIESYNRANKGYSLAINHLADKTEEELKILLGRTSHGASNGAHPFHLRSIPESFDWRLYGSVTPVKDQSVCGSCWAFGTTGTIEGSLFLKTKKLIRLSQQALIDCSWGFGNNGCDGGEDFRAYQWMLKHGGLPSEESYGPYLGQDGYCHAKNASVAAVIKGYVNVSSGDQKALKVALLQNGPISVAIDAGHRTFSFYSNGVYYEPNCGNKEEQLNHAVLLVGYGIMNDEPYWLIKNSWSTYWGNDGYILISQKDNNCGVATLPTFVLM